MNLQIQLPFQVFLERTPVLRVVAETADGSFGLWPQRLDMVASLTPGIFMYETSAAGELYLAVDEGVLIKAGAEVRVSVRRAVQGSDLHRLRDAVEREFLSLDEREQSVRSVMTKLETGFLRRLSAFQHG